MRDKPPHLISSRLALSQPIARLSFLAFLRSLGMPVLRRDLVLMAQRIEEASPAPPPPPLPLRPWPSRATVQFALDELRHFDEVCRQQGWTAPPGQTKQRPENAALTWFAAQIPTPRTR